MSTKGYANFLTGIGHKVYKSDGVYWFNAHPHIYMSFPFQVLVDPSSVTWPGVMSDDAWAVRFPCELSKGRESYRIIVDDSDYSLQSLTGKARNQTRRGLENCEVREVSFEELLEHAMPLNRETLERQGRVLSASFEKDWANYYKQAKLAEGAHAWGSFIEGKLVAYLIAFTMEGVSHILIVRSSRKFLKKYPNNALIYSYLHSILKDGQVGEVSIGLESIQAGMGALDHFKKGLGFRKEPIGQKIILKPAIAKVATKPITQFGSLVCSCLPKSEKLSKFSGLLRWYNEQPK